MTEQTVLIERNSAGTVETVIFNRYEKRNALSYAALRALNEELRRLSQDESVRVVVLRGSGNTFCSGLDLREATNGSPISRDEALEFGIEAFERDPDLIPRGRVMPRLVQEAMKRVKLLPQIVVGLAEGAACGGGAGLLSACDYVVAERGFRFAFTETKRGLYPTLLFPFLKRKFPITLLQEAVFTARPLDAEFAKAAGLANRIESREQFDAAVNETVDLFLSNEPNALREAKRLFAQETLPPDSEIDRGWEGHWASWNSEQGREGVRAFLEKR